MRAFPIACLLLVACSGVRPPPAVDRSDSCASVAQRLERTSPLSELQKQQAFDDLKGHTVEWSVRVLAVSQFADNLDGPRSFSVDVECDNFPRVSGAAMRYLMTLYVSDPHAEGIETLRRGAIVPVRATLRRYEGRSAFSAKAFLLHASERTSQPRPDAEAPEGSGSAEAPAEASAPAPRAAPSSLAPVAPPPSEAPKAKEAPRTKPKAAPPRPKPRGR